MTAQEIAAKLRRYKAAYVDGKRMWGYGSLISTIFTLVIELADRVAILEKENG